MSSRTSWRVRKCLVVFTVVTAACGPAPAPTPVAGSGDAAFSQLAREILDDHYKRNPSEATDLGIHQYDDQLDDLSRAAIESESSALKAFRSKVAATDPATLTDGNPLDREQLLHAIDAEALRADTTRMWTKDPEKLQNRLLSIFPPENKHDRPVVVSKSFSLGFLGYMNKAIKLPDLLRRNRRGLPKLLFALDRTNPLDLMVISGLTVSAQSGRLVLCPMNHKKS